MHVWQDVQYQPVSLFACLILEQNGHYIGPPKMLYLYFLKHWIIYVFSVICELGSDNSDKQQRQFGLKI